VPATQTLVVITGPPGSGKSTLARALGVRLHVPVYAKDSIKEALFDGLGEGDREWSRRLSEAAYGVMFRLAGESLDAGGSAIVEGNFRPKHAAAVALLANRPGLRLVQLVLYAPARVLVERIRGRAADPGRHPGHADLGLLDELREDLERGVAQPLSIDGVRIPVDTATIESALPVAVERVAALVG
jgi:predicted kinase